MKYIIGNQKSSLSLKEAEMFAKEYQEVNTDEIMTIICPSSSYFHLYNGNIGSQDVSILSESPLTGNLTASQLKSMNINYSLVGHSERRTYLNETDQEIKTKIENLLKEDIVPILCIGETLEQYQQGMKKGVILEQLKSSFIKNNNIIIAYEPVWAIGTGLVPTNEEIIETTIYIKDLILKEFGISVKVLYGGSVNPNNIEELEQIKELDGYLIGGASNKFDSWNKIVEVTRT